MSTSQIPKATEIRLVSHVPNVQHRLQTQRADPKPDPYNGKGVKNCHLTKPF